MNLVKEIKSLIWKDLTLEWRQRYALNGILLYILMVVFIIFLSFSTVPVEIWSTLFWIIMLFASVNAIAKSFVQESRTRDIYYYTLASPQAVIISKMVYNILLMLLLALIGISFYSLILGFPVVHPWVFLFNVVMGAVGFSITFTMVAAIASKASNNSALMAILSFPIFVPMLMILINISRMALEGYSSGALFKNFILLGAIDIIVVVLSLILFPYLWRD